MSLVTLYRYANMSKMMSKMPQKTGHSFPKNNFLDSGLWCHLDPRTFSHIIHDAYLYTQIGVRSAVVRIGVTFFFRCHFFSRLPQSMQLSLQPRPLCSSCVRRRTCLRHDRSVWLSQIGDECGEAIKFSNWDPMTSQTLPGHERDAPVR
jgi:hypothetical protein